MVNFLSLTFVIISLIMKLIYESRLNQEGLGRRQDEEFLSFIQYYIFYDTIAFFDSLIVFFIALASMKYSFKVIPALDYVTNGLQKYLSSTVTSLMVFVIVVNAIFAAFFHSMFSYISYGFYSYIFSYLRTNMVMLSGNLFNFM